MMKQKKQLLILIRRNKKDNFVEKTVKLIGYPRWDKTIFLKNPKISHSRTENNPDSNSIFYIPFVRDSQNYVNASLIIKVQQGYTTLSYACDWQYQNKVFGSPQIDTSAERHALLFMLLDNRTFGYTKFNITDSNLFAPPVPGHSGHRQLGIINTYEPPASGRGNLTELLVYNEICLDFYVCGTPDADECYNGCDYLNCPTGQCYLVNEVCEGWWEETGGGGGGTGGTGGTGGSGGSGGCTSGCSTPPECPGTHVARTEDVTNPCTPGWNPNTGGNTTNFPENPCKVVDSLMTTNNFPLYYQNLRAGVTNNFETGFMFWNPFSPNTTFEQVDGVPGTLGVDMNPATPMDGEVHNHYNDSLSLSVFSFDDFYKLFDWFSNGNINNLQTFTFGMVSDSSAYIMMITDSTAFLNFGNTYLNNRENARIFMSVFYDGYGIHEDKSVAENEKAFLKALQGLGTGITLFRANSSITQFTRIRVNENDQVRPSLCN